MRPYLLTLLVLTLLAACAGPVKRPSPPVETPPSTTPDHQSLARQAVERLAAGRPLEALRLYDKAATLAPSPQREALELEAVKALLAADRLDEAQRRLDTLRERLEQPELVARHRLLEAELSLVRRRPQEALVRLGGLNPETLPPALRARFLRLRVAALELSGERLEAAHARIQLDPLLTDETHRLANQRDLLEDLESLGEAQLRTLLAQSPPSPLKGWMELALLMRTTPDPLRREARLRQWRENHPDHPILAGLLTTLAPPELTRGISEIRHIALLLPLSGPLAQAGMAIRDGFLAAYYGIPLGETPPQVIIYDTAGKEDIVTLYQRAVADGADRIIGPLDKRRLADLLQGLAPQRPTLALNYPEDPQLFADPLYFFGLSPQNEAEQVAQRAWQDGHNRAAVIVPESRWGNRMAGYFEQAWREAGGDLASVVTYPPKHSDFSKSIKKMLNLDQSEARRRSLQRLLKTRLRFEPRRRQDVDFVFMAAFPRQARLIAPQLRFHHAADLAVYTTSHAYAGKRDPRANRDMDGVILGDIPWLLEDPGQFPHLQAARRIWPQRSDSYGRLFALGADAYNLLYFLDWFRANPDASLRGATGLIEMDDRHRMHRRLSWAKFVRGVPRRLPPLVRERLP